jgi:hypothetical protein
MLATLANFSLNSQHEDQLLLARINPVEERTMDPNKVGNYSSVGELLKSFVESIPTSSVTPEEILSKLESFDIDWWITERGDLFIRYWQIGAENFVPVERVVEVRSGRPAPKNADRLEWVSEQLEGLRASYAGRWVAITEVGVVASALDLSDLVAEIDRADVKEPFITQIPEDPVVWRTAYADN